MGCDCNLGASWMWTNIRIHDNCPFMLPEPRCPWEYFSWQRAAPVCLSGFLSEPETSCACPPRAERHLKICSRDLKRMLAPGAAICFWSDNNQVSLFVPGDMRIKEAERKLSAENTHRQTTLTKDETTHDGWHLLIWY